MLLICLRMSRHVLESDTEQSFPLILVQLTNHLVITYGGHIKVTTVERPSQRSIAERRISRDKKYGYTLPDEPEDTQQKESNGMFFSPIDDTDTIMNGAILCGGKDLTLT